MVCGGGVAFGGGGGVAETSTTSRTSRSASSSGSFPRSSTFVAHFSGGGGDSVGPTFFFPEPVDAAVAAETVGNPGRVVEASEVSKGGMDDVTDSTQDAKVDAGVDVDEEEEESEVCDSAATAAPRIRAMYAIVAKRRRR